MRMNIIGTRRLTGQGSAACELGIKLGVALGIKLSAAGIDSIEALLQLYQARRREACQAPSSQISGVAWGLPMARSAACGRSELYMRTRSV